MNCLEFRRAAGAEPGLASAEILDHRAGCPACARFQDQMRALNVQLGRALAVDPAALTGHGRRSPTQRWWTRGYALAASVLLGVALAAGLWVAFPAPTLATEVLGHLRHEPYAWDSRSAVQPAEVAEVLGPDGVRLREGSEVTYAWRCWHERHWVPHLVVQTAQGPVTVLLLAHREVAGPTPVADAEFTGVVLPAPRGSVAIAARAGADLDAVAQEVFSAVVWE